MLLALSLCASAPYTKLEHPGALDEFANRAGIKVVHLHDAGGPDDVFLQSIEPLRAIGVASGAVDCSAVEKSQLPFHSGSACTRGLIYQHHWGRARHDPYVIDAGSSADEVVNWVAKEISCADVQELGDKAAVEKLISSSKLAIVMFTEELHVPKLLCHLAMQHAHSQQLRFARTTGNGKLLAWAGGNECRTLECAEMKVMHHD